MIHQLAGKLFFMTLAFINKVVDQPAFDNHNYWIRTNHHRGFHPQVIFDEKKKSFKQNFKLLQHCCSCVCHPYYCVCYDDFQEHHILLLLYVYLHINFCNIFPVVPVVLIKCFGVVWLHIYILLQATFVFFFSERCACKHLSVSLTLSPILGTPSDTLA